MNCELQITMYLVIVNHKNTNSYRFNIDVREITSE